MPHGARAGVVYVEVEDTDGDGMPDFFESEEGFDPEDPSDAALDADQDGRTNLEEFRGESDPRNSDTDGDGLSDGYEAEHDLNWLDPASPQFDDDEDGLTAGEEFDLGTDPTDLDTDDDRMEDGFEIQFGFDPLVVDGLQDADGDGLSNADEESFETDPREADTDGDGMPDGFELSTVLDPLDPADVSEDFDRDGVGAGEEFTAGTDPAQFDSDDDGYGDGEEIEAGTDPLDAASHPVQLLDETCTAEVFNRRTQVDPRGNFAIANIPIPPSAFRVRFICERNGTVERGASDFVFGVPNSSTPVNGVTFGAEKPIPVDLEITSPRTTLTPSGNGAQLVTTGTLVDGTEIDLTFASSGTFYLSSNPAIATITEDGFVTGVSSGRVLITATHEGVIATFGLDVQLEDDSDGDGLPDDFESANGLDPGGINLTRLPSVTARASSESVEFPAERAIDGDLLTSWFTEPGDAANLRSAPFIEVAFPDEVAVAQVRVFGNRSNPDGFDIFAGIVQAFDASGLELFRSAEQFLPGPNRDLTVPVDTAGVRRVRFTSTDDESNTPGLAEIEVVSSPGGRGLDPGNPNDATVDFDGDGLTNLEEFDLGTSVFHNDTDGDGLTDDTELGLGSSPLRADTDGDGLLDVSEPDPTGDLDGDGLITILDPDSDDDGLPDGLEVALGLDPLRFATLNDGIPDGSRDGDGDGLVNGEEVLRHTDAVNPDTDGDGLTDGEEAFVGSDGFVTDPLRADTDGDGMPDGYESRFGLDPTDPSDAALDSDGDGLTNLEESQAGSDPFFADAVPPAVAEIDPSADSVGVPVNTAVVVRFAEPLLASSVEPGTVRLVLDGGGDVDGSLALSADGLSVTFTPDADLFGETTYRVLIDGLRDLARNPMAAAVESTFTTEIVLDTVAPTVTGTSPVNLERVPVNVPVMVEFSERMDPASFDASTFVVRDPNSQALDGMVQVDSDGRRAFFIPERPLLVRSTYRVTVSSLVRDLAGNRLPSSETFRFSTTFTRDTQRPILIGSSPVEGETGAPVNAVVTLQFDEPLNRLVPSRGFQLLHGGEPVPGSMALSDGFRRISFTPAGSLTAGEVYEIVVTTDLTDVAGNPLDNPGRFSFTAGAAGQIGRPEASIEPVSGSSQVGLNAAIRVAFDQRINPVTVTDGTFMVVNESIDQRVGGALTVEPTLRAATFQPTGGLVPGTDYSVTLTDGIQNQAGATLLPEQSFFSTAAGDDLEPPTVTLSPGDGALGVPVNAQVVAGVSEAASLSSAETDTLQVTAGGVPVPGTLTLDPDRTRLTFVPETPLAADTAYTARVEGLTDGAGNVAATVESHFRTATSTASDTERPIAVAYDPPFGATGVDPARAIAITFSEPVDPTTIGPETVQVTSEVGGVAGTYGVDGDTVTFTPVEPFPGDQEIEVRTIGYEDWAGNSSFSSSSRFTTGPGVDTIPPSVVSIFPPPGSEVGSAAIDVVLTFSESVQGADREAISFFADGTEVFLSSFNFRRSSDDRSVTIAVGAGFGKTVRMIVSEGVADLSGNPLEPFEATFSTADLSIDEERPRIAAQRPANGATGVDPGAEVFLFASEPLDPSTVDSQTVGVAQDDVLLFGDVELLPAGQTIHYTPSSPLAFDAMIEAFADRPIEDLAGNLLFSDYQGSFRTARNTTLEPPEVLRTSPMPGSTNVPRNALVEVEVSEPLAPSSVDSASVSLEVAATEEPVAVASLSLVGGGRVIRLEPDGLLASGTEHRLRVGSEIRDLDGEGLPFDFVATFTTGAAEDLTGPSVVTVSPPDELSGVPVNAHLHLLFDESVNPLSVTGDTVLLSEMSGSVEACSIAFSEDDRRVLILPHRPLRPETSYAVLVEGVTDGAGNSVAPFASSFTTGSDPDGRRPRIADRDPADGAEGVPVNAVIGLELDEPIDPVAVSPETVIVEDLSTGDPVAGTTSVSVAGRRIDFLPDAPLPVGRAFQAFVLDEVTDVSGNALFIVGAGGFTTSFESDATAPTVQAISPPDGFTGVPRNATPAVRFDEPVASTSLGSVRLEGPAGPVELDPVLVDSDRRLVLHPQRVLDPSTTYTLTVDGVRDRSGNTAAVQVSQLTTGSDVLLERTAVRAIDPPDDVLDVGTDAAITAVFTSPVDPTTIHSGTVRLEDVEGIAVPGTFQLSADLRRVSFTPDGPLGPHTIYRVDVSNATDLAGDSVLPASVRFTTGPGADLDAPGAVTVTPRDGASGVPVNVLPAATFDEPLSGASLLGGALELTDGGGPVPGTVELDADHTTAIFRPDGHLDPGTVHTFRLEGATDLSGNPLPPMTASFTTGASSDPDLTEPSVTATDPPAGAAGVSVFDPVVVTFDEPIAAHSVNATSVALRARPAGGSFVQVATDAAVDGATVTLLPLAPLPGDSEISVAVNPSDADPELTDLAGNPALSFFSDPFTTGPGADLDPPHVELVHPPDGSTGVRLSTGVGSSAGEVVLIFSESLDPETIGPDTFAVLAGGAELPTTVERSSDNRTIILEVDNLPLDSLVTVVVTSTLTDLSGNVIDPFESTFTTAPASDQDPPMVVAQRPRSGTGGVPPEAGLTLFVSEPLDPATADSGFYVSEDGALVDGASSVGGDGRSVTFAPAVPWRLGARVEVSLGSPAADLGGNVVADYRGSFLVAEDTSLSEPTLVDSSFSSRADVATNAPLDLEFSEALDPASVDAADIQFTPDFARTVSLRESGRVLRITPSAELPPDTVFEFRFAGELLDLDGQALNDGFLRNFRTALGPDTIAPGIVSISPPDDTLAVGTNADIRVRFDEPINPLTATESTFRIENGGGSGLACSLTLDRFDMEATLTPLAPFPEDTPVTFTVDGVEDLGGNPVTPRSVTFTTTDGPDTTRPELVALNPPSGSTSVPVNTVIEIVADEAIDSGTASDLRIEDEVTDTDVPGSVSLSTDGRAVRFLPDSPLAPDHLHTVFLESAELRDISGNELSVGFTPRFTTSATEDTSAPQVVQVSPEDGATDVPRNTRVAIRFDEPIREVDAARIALTSPTGTIATAKTLTDADRLVRVTPTEPLAGATGHTVTIDGVRDIAGNPSALVTSLFATGDLIDLESPVVVGTDPPDGATGVATTATVTVTFSEPLDRSTVREDTLFLETDTSSSSRVEATVEMAPDGTSATLSPTSPLTADTAYRIRTQSAITDLAGNGLDGSTVAARFRTAP